jgi:hypothetical protein
VHFFKRENKKFWYGIPQISGSFIENIWDEMPLPEKI